VSIRLKIDVQPDEGLFAQVEADGVSVEVTCWDYQDGLGELLWAATSLLNCTKSAQAVAVWQLSGETWWVLDRESAEFKLRLVRFDEAQYVFQDGRFVTYYRPNSTALDTSLPFREFVEILAKALRLVGEPTLLTYQEEAAFPSVIPRLEQLERYLAQG